ncbi:MAG: hypothetical protein ACLPKB_35535 [Xanthobacteraceae bacterium]
MNKYLQTTAIAMLVLGGTAVAQAQSTNPNDQTTNATVNLTPDQEAAIYKAVTDGRGERGRPEIRLGDEVPSRVKLSTLPDSLQLQAVKGLRYFTVTERTTVVHNDVILVDPATDKVVRIIQK